MAGITTVKGDEDIMVITSNGVMIRFEVANVSQTKRATMGVRLIKINAAEQVSTMAKVDHEQNDSAEKE